MTNALHLLAVGTFLVVSVWLAAIDKDRRGQAHLQFQITRVEQ